MGLIYEVGAGPVALDTAAFIHFIEAHTLYLPPLLPLADEEHLTVLRDPVHPATDSRR